MARRVIGYLLEADRWLSVLGVLCGFAAWEAIHLFGLVPADLLPGPGAVWHAFIDIVHNGYRGTTLTQDTLATLGRCLGGFVLACVTGVPLGLAMGHNRKMAAAFDYIIQFMRPLPPLSYLVLLILWLGLGDTSKVALLYLSSFPIIVSSSMAGVRAVRLQKVQAALSLGASPWQIFRYVILPSAMPLMFTGMRIALAVAFSTVVAAELMGATDGLGWMVLSASQFLRNDVIILGIALLGILGMALSGCLLWLDRYLVHWRGKE